MDRETDLIVIGGGAAGLSAALTAAENGLRVLILEKEAAIGGSSMLSGGSVCLAGTDIQEANGISDAESILFDDLVRAGGHVNDRDVVKAYTNNQLETYNWLRNLGVEFGSGLRNSHGNSVLRTHTITPSAVLPLLLEKAEATNLVEVIYGARAWRLVTDSEGERVVGVEIDSETPFIATAKYGVVLASGGFTRAPDIIQRFAPAFSAARVSGGKGNTGDGLLMAWKQGADLIDFGFIQGNYGVHAGGKSNVPVHPIFKGGIAVNQNGIRYVDESVSFKMHSDACMAQPGQVTYQIFDQNVMDRSDDAIPSFSFRSRVATGDIIKADTLCELAEHIGVPAHNLVNTVERYNAAVDAGGDTEFGRTALTIDGGPLVKLETGPFYAYAATVVILGTYCGIKVDGAMRVVDVIGMEIDGLYAAGEIVGGFHGRGEIPGAALGKAFIFGRIAAKSALAYAS